MTTLVVKLGGHALERLDVNAPVLCDLASDVAALAERGTKVVLVHGGGPQIAELLGELSLESQFVDGLRVTNERTMDVVAMALSHVNVQIVATLNAHALRTVGLTGADATLLRARALGTPWGRAAVEPVIDATIVRDLLALGYTPVISSVGVDKEGALVNCNADTMAGALAAALETELVLLSDVDQVRQNPDDASSVVASVSRGEVVAMLERGVAREGMRPKLTAALDALNGGAPRVRLANGRREHALAQLLSGALASTEVTP